MSLFPEILPLLILPSLSRGFIEAMSAPDVKTDQIARILEAHPYYLDALRRRWLALAKPESAPGPDELPKAEFLLVQLGMEGARDFLLSVQASRQVLGVHPFAAPDGSLGWEPAERLKFARRAQAAAAQLPGENASLAYAGGLLFDWLALLRPARELGDSLEAVFDEGLKAAQIATALARRLTEPDYPRLERRCTELAVPRVAFEFVVRRRFGTDAATLAALACAASGRRDAVRALLLSERPYLLRSGPRDAYLLAATLRLASNMARRPARVDSEHAPEIARWKGLELREYPMPAAEVAEISRMI